MDQSLLYIFSIWTKFVFSLLGRSLLPYYPTEILYSFKTSKLSKHKNACAVGKLLNKTSELFIDRG